MGKPEKTGKQVYCTDAGRDVIRLLGVFNNESMIEVMEKAIFMYAESSVGSLGKEEAAIIRKMINQ